MISLEIDLIRILFVVSNSMAIVRVIICLTEKEVPILNATQYRFWPSAEEHLFRKVNEPK